MISPNAIYVVRWLVRDTFRQARASGLMWVMLGVSALCTIVCLSASVKGSQKLHRPGDTAEFLPHSDRDAPRAPKDGVDVVSGELTLAFGAVRAPLGRDGEDAIRFLELLLAGFVADTAGLLLALIWTAGFMPTFLDPSSAVVIWAKPVHRWTLLSGKYLGVLLFVAFQAIVFVGGTWLALGLRTGFWETGYLLTVPLLLVNFAIFYSFSTLLAVYFRSTVTCVIGSLLFWLLCWGMNFGRHTMVALPHLSPNSPPIAASVQTLTEIGYWVLPKPADLAMLLSQVLDTGKYFGSVPAFEEVKHMGAFAPELSLLSCVAFAVVLLIAGAWQLSGTDY